MSDRLAEAGLKASLMAPSQWSGLRLLLDATRQGARREALVWAWDEIGHGDPKVSQDADRDCFVAEGLAALESQGNDDPDRRA